MLTLAVTSLSGGQGKTTTALFLGRKLAEIGYPTLIIDADPQHNQTVYLGLEIEERDPTLLEFLKKSVDFEETIYNTKYNENLFCIPADESLDNAVDYLSSSGVGATLLRRRLDVVRDVFKICIIDAPPQRSQIALTTIGASDGLIIPCEAKARYKQRKEAGQLKRLISTLKKLY